jgi:two-component system OmpR family sensor kinase
VLTVSDAGPGLSQKAYANGMGFFERFDPARSRENGGSGLGMSIMAGIVAKHGGTMTLAPSAAGGLMTTIRL